MSQSLKEMLKTIPVLGPMAVRIVTSLKRKPAFTTSQDYWEKRYLRGGTSGSGSYGRLAQFKAQVINQFIAEHGVAYLIEFGCGDGNQLALLQVPEYLGLDVSPTAIAMCRERYRNDPSRKFLELSAYSGQQATMTMSLDVIFHLVEDAVYVGYMQQLFAAAKDYVVIYSSDQEGEKNPPSGHFRHRKFTQWVEVNAPAFRLIGKVQNKYPYNGDESATSVADFFFYQRVQ